MRGPCVAHGTRGECWCGRFVYAEHAPPSDIIHAAEGVVLEPGWYEPVSLSKEEQFRNRFRREHVLVARHAIWDGNHWRFSLCGVLHTAVRRVEPNAESEKCASCFGSGRAIRDTLSTMDCPDCKGTGLAQLGEAKAKTIPFQQYIDQCEACSAENAKLREQLEAAERKFAAQAKMVEALDIRCRESRGLLHRFVKYAWEYRASTARAIRLERLVSQVDDYLSRTHERRDLLRAKLEGK